MPTQTKAHLQSRLGRDVCSGELYAAHFLGAGGACKLIEMKDAQPRRQRGGLFSGCGQRQSQRLLQSRRFVQDGGAGL